MRPHRIALASLASHSIGSAAYRLGALALAGIYAAQLGPESFGRLEQLLAISMLLVPLASWQVQEAFLAVYAKSPANATQAASALIAAAMLVVVIAVLALLLAGIPGRSTVLLVGLHVVTTIGWQFARNVVRNLGLLGHLLAAELGQTVVMLACGVAFLQWGADYRGAILAILVGNLTSCAVAALARTDFFRLVNPSAATRGAIKAIVGVASRLLPNVLLWWVIELSDRLLLAYYLGDRAVGVYSAGARLAGIGMAACLLIYQAWQVSAIRAAGSGTGTQYFRTTLPWFVTAVTLVFSAMLCVIGPLAPLLFGESFRESAKLGAAMVPGLYLATFCYFYGVVLYVPGSPVSAWRASQAGVVISVLLNVVLIPRYGAYAAALASLLAFSAVLLIRYREARPLIGTTLTGGGFVVPLVIILAQSATVVAGLGPGITMLGLALLVWLRREDLSPFLRAAFAVLWPGR